MQSLDLIDHATEQGARREASLEGFIDDFDLHIQSLILVSGAQLLVYVMGIIESADRVIVTV